MSDGAQPNDESSNGEGGGGTTYDLPRLLQLCAGWTIEYHPTVGSTNDVALRHAASDDLPTPLLVLTSEQTAGRGRGANRWWSARGAITCSAVVDLPSETPAERRSQIALWTGLAIRAALAQWIPQGVQVKWPNDIYVDGRKVSGILIETSASRPGRAVIGFGINVNNSLADAPAEIRQRAIAACERTGSPLDPTMVLAAVLRQLIVWLSRVNDPPSALAETWRPHCLLFERIVRLEVGGRPIVGRCHSIDQQGALVLHTAEGLEAFRTGIVASWE